MSSQRDLDVTGYVGPYTFPDNSRRRIPGILYLVIAAGLVVPWALAGDDAVLVNDGYLVVAIGLVLVAAYHFFAEVAAPRRGRCAGGCHPQGRLPGGPRFGSAGLARPPQPAHMAHPPLLRRRPPAKRGLVLVDAVDGEIVDTIVEDSPEDWSAFR